MTSWGGVLDHPRVGGEKGSGVISKIAGLGSPPRGRGKVMLFTLLPMGRGITPAWAGKSMIVRSVCLSSVDHPRVGGEKIVDFFCMVVIVGSPPRGRGKGRTATTDGKRTGITPAWAGKRSLGCNLAGCTTDHPRVGGEKQVPHAEIRRSRGSPPRGRGKARYCPLLIGAVWITPAWAGKSLSSSATVRSDKDHPRVGGEKCGQCVVVVGVKGSPPRGRGKADHISGHNLCARITPAWAGKSGISHAYRPRPRDHPRVGGEKQMQEQAGKYWVGSPPRGRGKAIKDAGERQAARITPAWAGKSTTSGHETTLPRDHPRVGGEKRDGAAHARAA